MSWKRHYSPELQQRRDKKREALIALATLKEQETREALGIKAPPPLKPGTMTRRARAGTSREMIVVDIYEGMLVDVNKTRDEARRIRGNNAPVIRRFTYGASKYDPKTEDRKHAGASAGGRVQRTDRITRRFLRETITGRYAAVRSSVSSAVAA